MNLEDKITSKEQLLQVVGEYVYGTNLVSYATSQVLPATQVSWWAVREHLRMQKGVYETTSALDKLNKGTSVFAHISKTNRDMVAFTPDKVAGESDRQVVTTFGRLASKLLPVVTDDYIRDLTAEHAGDLFNEVEFLEGQAIVDAYSDTRTVSSCMVNKSWPEGYEPSKAYMAPQIKMAVLRNEDGHINARTMIVEMSETDKRYIRIYGDPKLKRRLERRGYCVGDWQGVKFNKVPAREGVGYRDAQFLMPYLDAKGSTSRQLGSGLVYMNGELQGVTAEMHRKLEKVDLFDRIQTPGTSGFVDIFEIKESDYLCVDAVTGESFNKFDTDSTQVYSNGTLGYTTLPVQELAGWKEVWYAEPIAGLLRKAWMQNPKTFHVEWDGIYLEDAATREAKQFVKLNATNYPDREDLWVSKHKARNISTEEGEANYALKSDLVFWLTVEGEEATLTFKLKKELVKSDVRLHTDTAKGMDCYVPKGTLIYKTAGGRKVHPKYNAAILKRWDGVYDFPRNLSTAIMLGHRVHISRKEHDQALFEQYAMQQLEVRLANYDNLTEKLSAALAMVKCSSLYITSLPEDREIFSSTRSYAWTDKPLQFLQAVIRSLRAQSVYEQPFNFDRKLLNRALDLIEREVAEAQAADCNTSTAQENLDEQVNLAVEEALATSAETPATV
jgi:hypothetical protein